MTHREIRKKFFDYFVAQGHTLVPSSSLVPSGDRSVLLTTAGMQQFKPYFLGEADALADFGNRRLASIQKCFRTSDIDEVGDEHHHTFFEMLGNFSIGGYFKEQAILLAWNFLTKELRLDQKRMFVTVFAGDSDIPEDDEARRIWERTVPGIKVREFGRKENFWGPPGDTGPCGPCSEIHYILPSGLEVELWNLVFTEYFRDEAGKYHPLEQKNIDTGMGFERLVMILQGKEEAYETDLLAPVMEEVRRLEVVSSRPTCSAAPYPANKKASESSGCLRSSRIIVDHIRGAVFLIADGVRPLNVGRGYVLRRIIRRAILHGKILDINGYFLLEPAKKILEVYGEIYPELINREKEIMETIGDEEQQFGRTLDKGLRQLEKVFQRTRGRLVDAFALYDTYGFPLELTRELARSRGLEVDEKTFERKLEEQRERARAAQKEGTAAKELIAPQHTAAHLLNAALKAVLGLQVRQAGQHLEAGKFRHDFTFGRKLTDGELKKVEALVNRWIRDDLPVIKEAVTLEEAKERGAEAVFVEKYKEVDNLTMYCIGDSKGKSCSMELCAGPHAARTSELGHFEIIREEAAGAGVRRIYGRAVVD